MRRLQSERLMARQGGLKFGLSHACDRFHAGRRRAAVSKLMLEQTDAAVQYELDVCWAEAGGVNPRGFDRQVRQHGSSVFILRI